VEIALISAAVPALALRKVRRLTDLPVSVFFVVIVLIILVFVAVSPAARVQEPKKREAQ
jgi:hypothetical protein